MTTENRSETSSPLRWLLVATAVGFFINFLWFSLRPSPLALADILVGLIQVFVCYLAYRCWWQAPEVVAPVESVNEAVSEAVRALVHDTRRPFTLLTMGTELLGTAKTPEEIAELSQTLMPPVLQAIRDVEATMDDLVESGRVFTAELAPVSLKSLLLHVLRANVPLFSGPNLDLDWNFCHVNMVAVDAKRLSGALGRIYAYPIRNCKDGDMLSVATRQKGNKIYICMTWQWRNQPDISVESHPEFRLMRLEAAQKIFKENAGVLEDPQFETDGISVTGWLPADRNQDDSVRVKVPKSLSDLVPEPDGVLGVKTLSKDLRAVEAAVFQKSQERGRPLRLGIVDDEDIYRRALKGLVKSSEQLDAAIEVQTWSGDAEIIEQLMQADLDYLVCDVDLGASCPNGFEIVAQLRDKGAIFPICIHSNRSLPEDYQLSVEVGAQSFLPKPMTVMHLLKFLAPTATSTVSNETEKVVDDLLVAVVDDSLTVRMIWKTRLASKHLLTFTTPEKVLKFAEKKPDVFARITHFIIDQNFGAASTTKGTDLTRELASRTPAMRILSSEVPVEDPRVLGEFVDTQISKEPLSIDELRQLASPQR